MKQLIICICILIIAASCELISSSDPSTGRQRTPEVSVTQADNPADSITVFLTGNTLGSLKPCGCSGGQLGGLDRRPAVFNTVPVDKRLLIDTGSLVETQSDQDTFKFIVIIESLKYLNYNVVNLTKQDIEMAKRYGQLDNSSVGYISSYETDEQFPTGHQYEYSLNGEKIGISVVSFDPLEEPIESLGELFSSEPGKKSVNILIINNYSDEIISSISELGIVDCLVCPVKSDEPTIISARGEKPLVCAVGRFGRRIARLVIKNDPTGNIELSFDDIPVIEELKKDSSLVELYKTYQLMVKDANLIGQNPRYTLPDNLKYTGSESCSSPDCHLFQWVVWNENQHSHAYATLEEVGSQYDPECILCHVVGYDYESGFVSAEKTPKLENVGCEYCHGPGSAHNKSPYENKMTPIPDKIKLCEQCHTPEHSGDFAGNEEEKLEIIEHWTEPIVFSNVK